MDQFALGTVVWKMGGKGKERKKKKTRKGGMEGLQGE